MFYIFNVIFDYFKYLKYFKIIKLFDTNNINENNINIQIENFLKEIHENWKNKRIINIDMTCDILNLFIKYKKNSINNLINENKDNLINENKDNLINENKDIKYYTLGWYMYQCIENK